MSRKLKQFALLVLLACGTPFLSRGQAIFSLFPDSVQFFPDTIPANTVFTHDFYLQNMSPASYTGSISFKLAVGGFVDSILGVNNVTISQGDTLHFSILDSTMAPRYGGGVNIVVVWPDAPGVQTQDTFTHIVYVVEAMAFSEQGRWKNLKVFPVPAHDRMHIEPGQADLSEVWLVNAAGVPVRKWKGSPGEITVSGWPAGHYSLLFFDRNGERVARRIVIQ